jgi:hypothetical protein
MFVPSGVPTLLLPFLVIIEVISHLAKIFSLAIRLFANMMSGHVLLHILTGFIIKLAKKSYLFIILPITLILAIIVLEYGLTFLQAYVFTTLLAIYFEEHFSFAKEDQEILSKLLITNSQESFLRRKNFLFKYLIYFYERDIFVVFINRTKKERWRRVKHWEYTIITLVLKKSQKW